MRRALDGACCSRASAADLLFLEAWEAAPRPEIGIALRVHQIRRANPALAAAIRAELGRAGLREVPLAPAAPAVNGGALDFVLDFG